MTKFEFDSGEFFQTKWRSIREALNRHGRKLANAKREKELAAKHAAESAAAQEPADHVAE